jgi:hypothetical protein
MRRHLSSLLVGLAVSGLLASGLLIGTSTASAATIAPTVTCSNGVDDTPGLGLICETTIVNTFRSSGGSATVTVRECHGAAGDPTAACSTTTRNLTSPVTAVTQCNASTNGGGGTLRCSVKVTNRFVGISVGSTEVSVNQCVGSGDGIANNCDPFPATTSGATVTQCNGSANGGTLVRLQCTATGRESVAHPVVVNQCNGSTNGGGALVVCSTAIGNLAVAPAPSATPRPAAAATPRAAATPTSGLPNTSVADLPVDSQGGPGGVIAAILFLSALTLFAAFRRFGDRSRTR